MLRVNGEGALLSTLAIALVFALGGGIAAMRLRLPPIVGYLLAGVIVGPFTPGVVANTGIAGELAEIGVILLMFGVGMHFSLYDLLAVRLIALPGAVLQIILATGIGIGAARLWEWSYPASAVFGLSLSVASTVVLLRELTDRGILDSIEGRMAVGWLVVEDLITVVILVLLPALAHAAGSQNLAADSAVTSSQLVATLGVTFAKLIAFLMLMLLAGARLLPWLLDHIVWIGSRELFTLAVITIAIGIAFGAAELFGVSYALGAFFAGLVVRESDHSGRAASEMQPLQNAFTVIFFVAVGMLFDPSIMTAHATRVLAVVAIVVAGKSLISFLLVKAFRYPRDTALMVAASLGQIGEFSFILGELGVSLGLMPREGQNLIVAGALISITLNPLAFQVARRLVSRIPCG
jgi:CPA2 family monovalent cation:H+ antiporter-2